MRNSIHIIACVVLLGSACRADDGEALVRKCDAELAKIDNYEVAMLCAEELRDLGISQNDPALEARGLIRMVFIELHFGSWARDTTPWRLKALEIADAEPDVSITRAETILFNGYLHAMYMSQMANGMRDMNTAITIGRALQDDALLAKAYCLLGRVLPYDGQPRRSFEYLQRSIQFANAADMPCWTAFAKNSSFSTSRADNFKAYEAPIRLQGLIAAVHIDPAGVYSAEQCVPAAQELADKLYDPVTDHQVYVTSHQTLECLDISMFLSAYFKHVEDWEQFKRYNWLASKSAYSLQSEPKVQEVFVQQAAGVAQQGDVEQAAKLAQRYIDHNIKLRNFSGVSRVYAYVAQHMAKGGQNEAALEWYAKAEEFRAKDNGEAEQSMVVSAKQWVAREVESRRLRDDLSVQESSLAAARTRFTILLIAGPLVLVAAWHWLKAKRNQTEQVRLQQLVDEQTESLRIAKENAELANRAKTDFLARVNHELRNPLTAIVGSCEVLSAEVDENSVARRCADSVKACSTVLVDVIDDVLDFTQIESGQLKLAASEFALDELFETVQSIVETKLHDGVEFSAELDSELPDRIVADEAKLRQVLVNLGMNAARHTKVGSISLRCDVGRDSAGELMLNFAVTDTGCGMNTAAQASVFDQYETHSTESGTGLGLYISKAFVQCMGGEIACSSEPQKGTQFTVRIPAQPATGSHNSKTTAPVLGKQPLNVLVIDDEAQNRETVVMLLELMGHGSTAVATWTEAEVALQAANVDVVLLDLRMPEMNGYEMIQHIRGLELKTRPAVFAMTGDATSANRQQTAASGFDGFLAKPFTIANVSELLQQLPEGQARHAA